ncbi:MAG TPA: orotate phosphoribosyltransferase [Sulfurospirillum sp. UBA12182]|jgi:orotate phosphoribosyltransferase|nr:MAG TPA: orotate phosphoribosyltransferase [Sulfurospirillum sp. UBA12182]
MNLKNIYIDAGAYLQGHFLLSSGKHSEFYLQSAKVLEDPKVAEELAKNLAKIIQEYGLKVDTVCSPALGGVLAGYELARALGVRFIFAERVAGEMTIRRGFEVKAGENVLMCEDIITTGGSVLEASREVQKQGGVVVGFAALANRGFCKRVGGDLETQPTCKLPNDVPFFALGDFEFDVYDADECPLCKNGSVAYKPGSRGN